MAYLCAVVAAYLLGSIPVRTWVGNVRHGLIRTRAAAKELWILGLEMAKGALAASVGLLLAGWFGASLAAVAVVFGETFPLASAHGRGSGVATAAGALFVLSPLLIFIGAVIYFLSLLITRYHLLSTLCAVVGVLLIGLILSVHLYIWLVICCLAGFILLRLRNGRNRFFHRNPFRRRPFR
ncbi:glycerol-3-phosphate acyltransferase [Planifilum fimeticola]